MLYFDGVFARQTHLINADSVMNIVPLAVLFLLMQKHLVKGIRLNAVKG